MTIKEILEAHQKWLNNELSGICADLRGTNLERVNLTGVNLRWADLRGANLERVNLTGANLRNARLMNANLKNAKLVGADLTGADLTNTNLMNADLTGAKLEWADLNNASLRGTNFAEVNLDFSCLPLWCGSLKAHFDDKQIIQLIYHTVKAGLYSKNTSEETKKELRKMIDFANKFHRVDECGEIKV